MGFYDDMIDDGFCDPMDYEEYIVNKALDEQMEMASNEMNHHECGYYPPYRRPTDNSDDDTDSDL